LPKRKIDEKELKIKKKTISARNLEKKVPKSVEAVQLVVYQQSTPFMSLEQVTF